MPKFFNEEYLKDSSNFYWVLTAAIRIFYDYRSSRRAQATQGRLPHHNGRLPSAPWRLRPTSWSLYRKEKGKNFFLQNNNKLPSIGRRIKKNFNLFLSLLGSMGWLGREKATRKDESNRFRCWPNWLAKNDWSNLWRKCTNSYKIYINSVLWLLYILCLIVLK